MSTLFQTTTGPAGGIADSVKRQEEKNRSDAAAQRSDRDRKNKIQGAAERLREELHGARRENSRLTKAVKEFTETANADLLAMQAQVTDERRIHSELESKLAQLRRLTGTL